MGRKAINWNSLSSDSLALRFWNQNVQQFWLPEEYSPSGDKATWDLLPQEVKDTYKKVLVGLTHLDTEQGGEGMPLISLHVENQHYKSVLAFMGAMEHIHAKSYSNIFQSLITDKNEERELFEWQENNPLLQRKAELVVNNYRKLLQSNPSKKDLYMAMSTSVLLESFLFYSGFFYPLYLAGQGKMIHSGEIINAIIRDESIHGVFVGYIAQELYNELSKEDQNQVEDDFLELFKELYLIEVDYTKEIYAEVGLTEEVIKFVQYNANKAFANLGREQFFDDVEVNPIVLNGINTETKNHDFFSTKGNGYIMSVNKVPISDEDFAELELMLR